MREEFTVYLEKLFAHIPPSEAVSEAKEELLTGMLERYDDYRAQGMADRAAYDAVLDSIGDIHELFDALRAGESAAQELPPYYDGPTEGGGSGAYTGSPPPSDFGIGDFIDGIADFARDMFAGVFSGPYGEDVRLVSRRAFPMDGLHTIAVELASETIDLFSADDGKLTILEYMNRDEPNLPAEITETGGHLQMHTGRRVGVFNLRSRVEIYLPADWQGALSVSTMSGSVKSGAHWRMGRLIAKSVSGSIELRAAEASHISLRTTSGSVLAEHLCGVLELHSVSGSVKVDDAAGCGELKSVSGSVRARFSRLDGDLDASSVSGSVRLSLPADASFSFDGKSTSGSIRTGFDAFLQYKKRTRAHGFVGTPPHHRVSAKTVSGSICVNE